MNSAEASNFEIMQVSGYKLFLSKRENFLPKKFAQNQKKFTIKYSLNSKAYFLKKDEKKAFKKFFRSRPKVTNKLVFSRHLSKEIFYDLVNKKKYDEFRLRRTIENFSFKKQEYIQSKNNLKNLFDINFLKKERIYTKLKYSRVPQYDTVSGGAAALFAGFLGFLISEKFGFELVDSGDFYFLFMYLVFLTFFLKMFVKLMSSKFFS